MTDIGMNMRAATAAIPGTEARVSWRERLTRRRLLLTLSVLLIILALFAVAAISVGSEHIGIEEIARVILAEITGRTTDVQPEHRSIIADIRLPRVWMAIIVGASLSVAGAGYQALLRNPLADPYILGVSTGAAVGAILATLFGESLVISRPIAAFIGALVTIAIVYLMGRGRRGASTDRLILAGVITNSFFSSIVIFLLTSLAGSRLPSAFSWLMGDMSGEFRLIPMAFALMIAGMAVIFACARGLNLLMIGEEDALALGLDVGRIKLVVYVTASLITGAAVAISGVIGFVGLIIPHAVRLAGGSDNRLVVPASALAGAAFLLLADTAARTVVAPGELHVGVVTALVGAPAFVFLLVRRM